MTFEDIALSSVKVSIRNVVDIVVEEYIGKIAVVSMVGSFILYSIHWKKQMECRKYIHQTQVLSTAFFVLKLSTVS